MQANFSEQLRRAISHERLDAYRQRGTSSDDAELFTHYAWNMALSESLYTPLQCLEVCLRNSIHDAATAYFKTDTWFDVPGVLLASELDKVREAKGSLLKGKKTLDAGRIIPELTFGFWTSLLDVRYEKVLWPWLLKPVVPNMPRRIRIRKNLSKRFNHIRTLRNRIFHHEPIWHWGDLPNQHSDLLEAIRWVNPAMMTFVEPFDSFKSVYNNSISEYRKVVSALP
ncbi:protein of unknown function DUF1526 [Geotalea uraniireducens Rf4]|uniref:Abi-like protein n=2 Tax=Geotalea uraniireducens TaxID=351604 RepID=A5G922_GEOUR|nr:protein of unknown function DUF1526 [Geotalea uraniireducens Rf4]